MADIDQIIAGGAGAGSRYDFSTFGDPVKSFFDASKQADDRNLRRAFRDGLPTDANGQPDFAAMAKTLIQKGDFNQGLAAANLDLQRQQLRYGQQQSADIANVEGGGQPAARPNIVSPPSPNRNASVSVAPAIGQGSASEQPQQPQGGATIMKVLAAQGIPNDQLGAASASVARQLGLEDPNAPININDPQVRNVLVPAVQQLKRMGIGQIAQPGQPAVQTIPPVQQQVAQAAPATAPQPAAPPAAPVVAQGGQPAPVTDRLTTQGPAEPSRADKLIAYYSGIMSNPMSPKQNVELAKERLKALQDNAALTPDQKMYSQSVLQGYKGTLQDWIADNESNKAAATERAKGDFKEQQDYIDRGRSAGKQLSTLNAITNVIQSDKNMTLGYGGPMALKIKMALQQAGIDFGDLSGAQMIQKLNATLASEAIKSVSPRPTQFEFKTFLENNPGLALGEKGNIRLLGILSQNAKREYDLGKLARQNRDKWDNWDAVVEKYDRENPIKDPTTGKVLSSSSIIAPAEKNVSSEPQQRFGSPADVNAAIKAGKLKSGDSFLDSKGTTRYVP